MTAHTPGPWEIAGVTHIFRRGTGRDGANICSCSEPRASTSVGYTEVEIGSEDLAEAAANARLIAAAPELFESLRNLVGIAAIAGAKLHQYSAALDDARAALAKAESV